MLKKTLLLLMVLLVSKAQAMTAAPLEGGVLHIEFNQAQMRQYDLRIQWGTSQTAVPGYLGWQIAFGKKPGLSIHLKQRKFLGFSQGELAAIPLMFLEQGKRNKKLRLYLKPTDSLTVLHIVDSKGKVWLIAQNFHFYLQPESNSFFLDAMSINAGPAMLEWLGLKQGALLSLGRAILDARVAYDMPKAVTAVCNYPHWDDGVNYQTDIALESVGLIAQKNPDPLVIAPSARLRNVGTADVPWFRRFATNTEQPYPPPYQLDQHPILVWNMYRIDGSGLLRQIGQSQAKHAFNTVNLECSCNSGGYGYSTWDPADPSGYYASILWSANHPNNTAGVGCVDVYDSSTNNEPQNMGPRSEIPAYQVDWNQCGSGFAPNDQPQPRAADTACQAENAQVYAPGDQSAFMVVDPDELGDTQSTYLVEAWYLVRDDINIFNSMGHVGVTPTQDQYGGWSFPASQAFANGSILDAWVDPANPSMDGSSHTYDNGQGHAGLAVKVLPLGNGVFRWVLALVNHDYDPAITRLSFDIDPGLSVLQAGFYDVDADTANDWTFTQNGQTLRWEAPAGNALSWGRLYTFWFDMEAGPLPYRPMTSISAEPADLADTAFVFNGLMPAQRVFSDSTE